ncbi:MAG: ABC transporter permease, partial [Alphaproteobacteria bacterium]|nr:ABC transporter permease [Alphaproteobacteria bacterium]
MELRKTDLVILSGLGRPVLDLCETVGHSVMHFFASVGRLTEFALQAFLHMLLPPWFGRQIGRQFVDIGYYSLAVVGLTTLFSGMVLALQSYTGFARFNAEGAIANVVALSITRELAPVLAGLMVAGRIGASIAAEIGTMRVTEQIDALTTLSVNPFKYLVAPRILAGTLIMPVLVLIGDVIGIFGGFVVAVFRLGFNAYHYIDQTAQFLEPIDVGSGLVKAAVFGFIVTLMGC